MASLSVAKTRRQSLLMFWLLAGSSGEDTARMCWMMPLMQLKSLSGIEHCSNSSSTSLSVFTWSSAAVAPFSSRFVSLSAYKVSSWCGETTVSGVMPIDYKLWVSESMGRSSCIDRVDDSIWIRMYHALWYIGFHLTFRVFLPLPICRVEPRPVCVLVDVRCMTLRRRSSWFVESIKHVADWITKVRNIHTGNRRNIGVHQPECTPHYVPVGRCRRCTSSGTRQRWCSTETFRRHGNLSSKP